jgi:glutamate-1-semialdehyde 2,1-aminomutase
MADEIELYRERTKGSLDLYRVATDLIPLGVGSNFRYFEPYPFFVSRAKGARVWDVDENEYIDFSMCFGALNIGHSHPLLVKELKNQLENGTMYAIPIEMTAELSKEIRRRFPIDMVRYCNSGAEATMHAIRMARGYSGKDKIVKIEGCYHGCHDSLLVSTKPPKGKCGHARYPYTVPSSAGIPQGTLLNTLVAPYNDLESMENIFIKHIDEIGGLIMEPVPMNMGIVLPEEGYLQSIRDLTIEYNIPLIFDEVKTGVKIAPGGASKYFGIEPDIITFGKSVGGGLPLAGFAGKKEIMEHIRPNDVAHMGTYNANPLAIRAGYVTLTKILTEKAYDHINRLGGELIKGYNEIVEDSGMVAKIQSIGPMGCILFTDEEVKNYRGFLRCDENLWFRYWIAMLNRGIIPMPLGHDEQWTISVQYDDEDVQSHLEAFKEVAPKLTNL